MKSNYGFLLPYLWAKYENQPSQWHINCAGNLTDALRQIDFMDLGSSFQVHYLTFLSEKITCAMREVDRQKNTENTNDVYTELFQTFVNSFDDTKKQFTNTTDTIVFFYYVQILANTIQKYGYDQVSDALRKLLERTRIKWGYPYDIAYSFDATKSNAVVRPLNKSLSLVSKYHRKAKGVTLWRPQISRKNMRRIGFGSAVLLLSFIAYRRWGK